MTAWEVGVCTACNCRVREASDGCRCWGCGCLYHTWCTHPLQAHRRPWHCKERLRGFQAFGLCDVMLDAELMSYLAIGALAADMDVQGRCTLAARFLWLDEVSRL